MSHTETPVDQFPPCDLDPRHGNAAYDGKVIGVSSWAFMCEECFADFGVGLGLGIGQRLVLREVPPMPPLRVRTVGDLLADMTRHPSRRR